MISSLANFLMLILYRGGFPIRVWWIILMYTMGSVAVARIAIEQSRSYSIGYAAALAAAALAVISQFIGNIIASAILLGLIAYLADRIVHDCTLIDDAVDSSGQGLVDAGQEYVQQQMQLDDESQTESPAAKNRKADQPGRTVMYLALAAIPLFGIGQFLMKSDPATWSAAVQFLALYLFSSLSLLVTTSFLGLRRYLRQRQVDMPRDVSVAWLAGGLMIIGVILSAAYLAPLPGSALASFEVPDFLSSDKQHTASQYGWGNEAAEKTTAGAATTDNDPNQDGKEIESIRPQEGAPPGDSGDGKQQQGPAGKQTGGKQSGGSDDSGGQQKSDSKSQSSSQDGKQQASGANQNQSKSQQQQSKSSQQSQSQQQSQQDQSQAKPSQSQQQSNPQDQGQTPQPGQSDQAQQSRQSSQDSDAQQDAKRDQANQSQPKQSSQQSQNQDAKGQSSERSDKRPDDSQQSRSPEDSQSQQQSDSPQDQQPTQQSESDQQTDQQAQQEHQNESQSQDRRQQTSSERPQPESSEQSSVNQGDPGSSGSDVASSIGQMLASIGGLLRYLIMAVLIAVIVAYLWIYREAILLWWKQLFQREVAAEADDLSDLGIESDPGAPPRAFASFQNPIGREQDPRRVVVITFQAFEAWAREKGHRRGRQETPSEFVRRIADQVPPQAAQIVEAYNRIVYGRGKATSSDIEAAKQMWQAMENNIPATQLV